MTKEAKTYNGVKIVYLINGVGNIKQIHAKNEPRLPSYTTHKIKLKWIKDLNIQLKTIKILHGNIGNKMLHISVAIYSFSYISLLANETKRKNKQMALRQTKKFLHSKRKLLIK